MLFCCLISRRICENDNIFVKLSIFPHKFNPSKRTSKVQDSPFITVYSLTWLAIETDSKLNIILNLGILTSWMFLPNYKRFTDGANDSETLPKLVHSVERDSIVIHTRLVGLVLLLLFRHPAAIFSHGGISYWAHDWRHYIECFFKVRHRFTRTSMWFCASNDVGLNEQISKWLFLEKRLKQFENCRKFTGRWVWILRKPKGTLIFI